MPPSPKKMDPVILPPVTTSERRPPVGGFALPIALGVTRPQDVKKFE